jgi:hypothetical protein
MTQVKRLCLSFGQRCREGCAISPEAVRAAMPVATEAEASIRILIIWIHTSATWACRQACTSAATRSCPDVACAKLC